VASFHLDEDAVWNDSVRLALESGAEAAEDRLGQSDLLWYDATELPALLDELVRARPALAVSKRRGRALRRFCRVGTTVCSIISPNIGIDELISACAVSFVVASASCSSMTASISTGTPAARAVMRISASSPRTSPGIMYT